MQIGPQTYRVTALETAGEDCKRLWRQIAEMYKGYDGYAQKTTREIPVVVLQRR